jgi:polysaccharide pyruvyl transferase WcaK-like protein
VISVEAVPLPTDPSPFTLVLLGVTRNTENYGVRVLLSAATEALNDAFPGAEIVALDYWREPQIWEESLPSGTKSVPLINLRFSWKLYLPNNIFRLLLLVVFSRLLPAGLRRRLWNRNPCLKRIAAARAHFSIAGGDSFSDIYGLTRYVYVTLPQILVLLMQRPLVQLPQTYGPFRTAFARTVARTILRRSRTIFSRDEAGRHAIAKLLPSRTPTVHVVPDIGLAMSPEPLKTPLATKLAELRAQGPVVGLNVSRLLYIGGYSGTNMFGLRENFRALIDTLVADLAERHGVQVLLVPHVCGGPQSQEDETHLCRDLLTQYQPRFGARVIYVDEFLNHRQIKSLIGRCDLFIGARMHACVAAVSQAVPAVCLAYSGKFTGVMAPLGPGARVVDLRTATSAEILAAVQESLTNRIALANDLRSRLVHLPRISQQLATLDLS